MASYDRALALKPDFAEALQNRGAALSRSRAARGGEQRTSSGRCRPRRRPAVRPGERCCIRGCTCCDWRDYEHESRRVIADVRAGKRAVEPFMFLAHLGFAGGAAALRADVGARSGVRLRPTPLWTGERYRHDRIRAGLCVGATSAHHPTGSADGGAVRAARSRRASRRSPCRWGADDGSAMRSRARRRLRPIRRCRSDRAIAKSSS